MKFVIECWMNHHFPLHDKEIKSLSDLYTLIHLGHFYFTETDEYDQKIMITIEIEE